MYSKKYRLINIETSGKANPTHETIKNKICYLAYLNIGERGWFLCDTQEELNPVHRIHTSEIKDVQYNRDNSIVVSTENTKYTFKVLK
jgi:hypothetical protein